MKPFKVREGHCKLTKIGRGRGWVQPEATFGSFKKKPQTQLGFKLMVLLSLQGTLVLIHMAHRHRGEEGKLGNKPVETRDCQTLKTTKRLVVGASH